MLYCGNLGSIFGQHRLSTLGGTRIASIHEIIDIMNDEEKWKAMKEASIKVFEEEVEKNEIRKKKIAKYDIKVPDIWNPATFHYIVYSETYPELEGKNFKEIAKIMGCKD